MKNIIIFDLETTSVDPETTDPIQIGALAINQSKLEIIADSEFYSWIQPDNLHDPNYYNDHKSTIDWHSNNYRITPQEFLAKLAEAPKEKTVFENFDTYISKYHTKPSSQTIFTAPIFAGFNSDNFDLPILNLL